MPEAPATSSPRSDQWSSHAPSKSRKRKALWIASILVVLLAVAGGVAASGYYRWCQGASGAQEAVKFVVPAGATGTEIVSSLHAQGVTRCDGVARYIVKKRGLSSSFEAGEYHLTRNMTLDAALAGLAEGPIVKTVDFTVPEGWRLTQIADAAQKELGIPSHQFLQQAQSGAYVLPPSLPSGKETVEGFLFPKTYTFERDAVNADSVISRQLEQFDTETKSLSWGKTKGLGITPYEAVIVASMIERETAIASERPLVSAVIYNRLQRGEILGIDATLQYIDPDPSDGLTDADLAIENPYNTRIYKGLPPTPIGSPSLSSLRAALNPAHSDVGYYVACGSGGHHKFTASYEEFQRLKQECLG